MIANMKLIIFITNCNFYHIGTLVNINQIVRQKGKRVQGRLGHFHLYKKYNHSKRKKLSVISDFVIAKNADITDVSF